jgi:Ca-activated chloride channel family protein
MLLSDSEHKGQLDYPLVMKLASESRGKDAEGYRGEFLRLLESAETLDKYPKQKTEGR